MMAVESKGGEWIHNSYPPSISILEEVAYFSLWAT